MNSGLSAKLNRVINAIFFPVTYPCAYMPLTISGSVDRVLETSYFQEFRVTSTDWYNDCVDPTAQLHQPQVFTSLSNSTAPKALWALEGNAYPMVHFQDAICPLVFPTAPPLSASGYGDRRWQYGGLTVPGFDYVLGQVTSGCGGSFTAYTVGVPSGVAAPTGATALRPVCRSRQMATSDRDLFWIDACATATSRVTIQLNFTATVGAPLLASNLAITVRMHSPNQTLENQTNISPVSVFNGVNTISAVYDDVKFSGFYNVDWSLSCPSSAADYSIGDITPTLFIDEHTTILTTFLMSTKLGDIARVAEGYYITGSTMLISPDFSPLSNAGYVYGVSLDQTFDCWQDPVSAGLGDVTDLVPPMRQCAEGHGNNAADGMYLWEFPTVPQRQLCEASLTDNRMVLVPPRAYICYDARAWNGSTLVCLTTGSGQLSFRVRTEVGFTYAPCTQLIRVCGDNISILTDEMDMLMFELARFNRFTTNDWHFALLKLAALGSKFASGILRGAYQGAMMEIGTLAERFAAYAQSQGQDLVQRSGRGNIYHNLKI